MGLRDIGATLPPGFRFYPSDEELVCHYLYKKIANEEVLKGTLVEIDLHTCEPWQLPDVAKLNASEWYFFSFRDRKYATGFRTNRATISGYWKATGKDRTVHDPATREIVGMRKTLVFYRNRAPNGIKSGWIMHEFRLETPHMPPKEDWVLCRVFHRSKASESNSRLSPPYNNMLETGTAAISPPSLNLATPADHHRTMNIMTTTMPSSTTTTAFVQQPCLSSTTSSCFQDTTTTNFHSSLLQHLLLHQYSSSSANNHQDANLNNYSISDINSKVEDDECGFLWDSNIEENSQLVDGVVSSSNQAGTGTGMTIRSFEMDNNSMVFI